MKPRLQPSARERGRAATEPLFARVMCGIDGSPAAQEAARQAALLAGGGSLELVSVTWTTGAGPTRMAALSDARARRALESATALAAEQGTPVSAELVHASDEAGTIGRLASGYDLIAVGARPGARAGGIMLGSVASRMVHQADVPVLVARRPQRDAGFPDPILLASNGSKSSARAATLAARIAAHLDCGVLMLRVGTAAGAAELREVARQAGEIVDATGRKPVVVELGDKPLDTIVDVARTERTSLIVIGSRRLSGVKALASVSERVAHEAPCSVLVARG